VHELCACLGLATACTEAMKASECLALVSNVFTWSLEPQRMKITINAANFRKSSALFTGSKSSPACPSDKSRFNMKVSMEYC
jgi:hypothetical protein